MVNKKKVRTSLADKTFNFCNIIFMLLVIITTIYPFWYVIILSFSGVDSGKGIQFLPNEFTLDAYKVLLDYDLVWIGYRNTIIRCIIGTTLSITFTAMAAYPLSKKDLPFNNFFTNVILFTMMFGGGLIPSYLLVKDLHLLNTVWALVLPGMLGAFNIFIMRNFFRAIPASLEESARIDGAGWFYIWIKIILPLSMPVLATVTLWILVGHWNSWFDALIYITDISKTVVQVILRRITLENSATDVMAIAAKMAKGEQQVIGKALETAMVVVTIIPMLITYPFLQKYFVKGIMIGSIKG